ncbi:hypothetical protein FACS1894103_0650 [Campylobacterota bacterium]|nr:hypothetical protein FACS1894103_0460 [Campylobacterota bacterium]GHV58708.1 hypothetical protein FACS1894103_0650 [Campylobacterota bacterium]
MVMMNFDTLNAVKQLQGFGFEQRQAEGVVEVLKETQSASIENLATKDDIKDLCGEMKVLEISLRGDMKAMDASLSGRIDAIKAEFVIFKWMFGVLTAAVVSFVIKSFFSL